MIFFSFRLSLVDGRPTTGAKHTIISRNAVIVWSIVIANPTAAAFFAGIIEGALTKYHPRLINSVTRREKLSKLFHCFLLLQRNRYKGSGSH